MNEETSATVTIKRLLDEGRAFIREKTPSQARSRLAEAWALAMDTREDGLAIEVALLMSELESLKLQQQWIVRAIQIAEKSSRADARHRLGSLHNALGLKLLDLKQYESAQVAFEKVLTKFKSESSSKDLFRAKWSMGKLLRVTGQLEDALKIQNELLAALSGISVDGRVYQELAECLHALKRQAEAKPYFDMAYRELSVDPWIKDNEPEVLTRLKNLAKP